MWRHELALAIEAAKSAGQYLLENSNFLSAVLKSENKDIKLMADFASERIIIEIISNGSIFPILSEEMELKKDFDISEDAIYWIIDPLDGSLNYSQNIPLACVSIALWEGKKPLLGVIYDFNRNELFSRIVGGPLFVNGAELNNVYRNKPKKSSVITTGFPSGRTYDDESLLKYVRLVQGYKKVRLLGSAALSLAWLSVNRVDYYAEEDIYLWDVAAGLALVNVANIIEIQDNFKLDVLFPS